jgi:hypothetical protein
MLDLLWLGLCFFGALTSGDLSSHSQFLLGKSIQDALSKIPRVEPNGHGLDGGWSRNSLRMRNQGRGVQENLLKPL